MSSELILHGMSDYELSPESDAKRELQDAMDNGYTVRNPKRENSKDIEIMDTTLNPDQFRTQVSEMNNDDNTVSNTEQKPKQVLSKDAEPNSEQDTKQKQKTENNTEQTTQRDPGQDTDTGTGQNSEQDLGQDSDTGTGQKTEQDPGQNSEQGTEPTPEREPGQDTETGTGQKNEQDPGQNSEQGTEPTPKQTTEQDTGQNTEQDREGYPKQSEQNTEVDPKQAIKQNNGGSMTDTFGKNRETPHSVGVDDDAIFYLQTLLDLMNEGTRGMLVWTMLRDPAPYMQHLKDNVKGVISVKTSCPTKKRYYKDIGIGVNNGAKVIIYDDAAAQDLGESDKGDLVIFITCQTQIDIKHFHDRKVETHAFKMNVPTFHYNELSPMHAQLNLPNPACEESHLRDMMNAHPETVAQVKTLIHASNQYTDHNATAYIVQYPRFWSNDECQRMIQFLRRHCCTVVNIYGFPPKASDNPITQRHVAICFRPPESGAYSARSGSYNMAALLSMLPVRVDAVKVFYHFSTLYM